MLVSFFQLPSGRSPVEEFIQSLPKRDMARCLEVVVGLEDYGFACQRVRFKPLRGKLWEVKFQSSGGGYRFLYVLMKQEEMVILHASKKKTQKTPIQDIKLAEKRMKEVLSS